MLVRVALHLIHKTVRTDRFVGSALQHKNSIAVNSVKLKERQQNTAKKYWGT